MVQESELELNGELMHVQPSHRCSSANVAIPLQLGKREGEVRREGERESRRQWMTTTVQTTTHPGTATVPSFLLFPAEYLSSSRERELLGKYLQLLASLEHHTFTAQRHSQILDELVDLVDFSKN